jgi:Cys-tRNA(Pro) deacylase
MTKALAFLAAQGVPIETRSYAYVSADNIGQRAAQAIGVSAVALYKTLVFAIEERPVVVLIDSAHRVSTQKLARVAGATAAHECSARDAERHTGYQIGGISPFATKRQMDVYIDAAVTKLDRVFVNAGQRGLILGIERRRLLDVLSTAVVADLCIPRESEDSI